MVTSHHCPGLKQGDSCPQSSRAKTSSGIWYCTRHKVNCSKHQVPHLKTEKCPACEADKKALQNAKDEKIRKEKEEKERKKREEAEKRSARDKAPLTKKVKTVGGKK